VADLSWSAAAFSDTYLGISGTAGSLSVGWSGSHYRLAGDKDWIRFGHGYDKQTTFVGQLAHFAAAARGDVIASVSIQDALASVQVIEAAYRSAATERWEAVLENGKVPTTLSDARLNLQHRTSVEPPD
jgi:predicted dehydrogenase